MGQAAEGDRVRPPMNGALGIATKGIRVDVLAPDSLGYLTAVSNDPYNQNFTFVTSGPRTGGNGWSITPSNFEQSLLVMAIRLLPKHTWLNHYDQFNVPDEQHASYAQFRLDAIVWALFHGKNNASSLHPVSYKGVSYDIENQFFWTDPALMNAVKDKPLPIIQQLKTAKMRFVTTWLNDNLAQCSPGAQALAQDANLLVLDSLADRKNARAKWQLDRWDAGWYQLRMWIKEDAKQWEAQLKKITNLHKVLGDKLRPLVYELGCLPQERRYEPE